mmetsp:Transcript_25484/g.32888  ORF Transcript_25484/g.32888 Transcript_25484/m.32888 type:complete len:186 (+) Transcript_25484:72-629(+)
MTMDLMNYRGLSSTLKERRRNRNYHTFVVQSSNHNLKEGRKQHAEAVCNKKQISPAKSNGKVVKPKEALCMQEIQLPQMPPQTKQVLAANPFPEIDISDEETNKENDEFYHPLRKNFSSPQETVDQLEYSKSLRSLQNSKYDQSDFLEDGWIDNNNDSNPEDFGQDYGQYGWFDDSEDLDIRDFG